MGDVKDRVVFFHQLSSPSPAENILCAALHSNASDRLLASNSSHISLNAPNTTVTSLAFLINFLI